MIAFETNLGAISDVIKSMSEDLRNETCCYIMIVLSILFLTKQIVNFNYD